MFVLRRVRSGRVARPCLTMAPALLLLALLAGGFRPGEALIERLRDRRRETPLPRPAVAHSTPAARTRRAADGPAPRLRTGDAATPFRARSAQLALPRALRVAPTPEEQGNSMRKRAHHGPGGHRRGRPRSPRRRRSPTPSSSRPTRARARPLSTRISTVSVTFTGRDPQRLDQGHRPRRHGLLRQRRPRPAQRQAAARAAEVVQEGRHLQGEVDDEGRRRPHPDRPLHVQAQVIRRALLAAAVAALRSRRPPRPRTSRSARRSPPRATPCSSR